MQLAPESLRCGKALGETLVESSRSAGWTSLLVDRHCVGPGEEEFETAPTPDQTIVVMLKGEQHLEVMTAGLWRRTVYRPGTVGMTPGHKTDRLRRRLKGRPHSFEKANLYLPRELMDQAVDEFSRVGQKACEISLDALAFHDPLICHTVKRLVEEIGNGATDLYAAATAR